MTVFDMIVKDDQKIFVVCHRVRYTLFGEEATRTIDIATNFNLPLDSIVDVVPEEVVRNAEETILVMNREYIDNDIPQDVIPFIINNYSLITNTGELLCQR